MDGGDNSGCESSLVVGRRRCSLKMKISRDTYRGYPPDYSGHDLKSTIECWNEFKIVKGSQLVLSNRLPVIHWQLFHNTREIQTWISLSQVTKPFVDQSHAA